MSQFDARLAQPRTLEELKFEVIERVKSSGYPGRGMRLEDAEAALSLITSLDPDIWAAAWMVRADQLMDQAAKARDKASSRDLYRAAYATYTMGRFPAPTSEGKQKSYEKGLDAYKGYTDTLDAPLEIVRIPFEAKEIVGYLRKPRGEGSFPLMVQCGGLDYLKEQIADEAFLFTPHGIAVFAVDMPGTGQAPILADVGSERMFSTIFDWAESRPDLDGSKMFMRGVSWGGHWATRVAFAEKDRILGANNHGGSVHNFFTPEWQLKALGTREYLMDLFGARAKIFGVTDLDEFLEYGPRMSLLHGDQIDGRCAPMLVANGVLDSQVPIADQILLLTRGDAKDGWINPKGMHMGFGGGWTAARYDNEVLIPWLKKRMTIGKVEAANGANIYGN